MHVARERVAHALETETFVQSGHLHARAQRTSVVFVYIIAKFHYTDTDTGPTRTKSAHVVGYELKSNQIKSNMTLIMVDKPQPSYNLLNVMK